MEFEGRTYSRIELETLSGIKYINVAGAMIDQDGGGLAVSGSCYPMVEGEYFCSLSGEGLYVRLRADTRKDGIIQFADSGRNILHTSQLVRSD